MRRIFSSVVFGFGVALVAITAVSAQNPGGSADGKKMKNPVASSPESIAAGQALFAKNCRFCHGPDAKGNGPQAPKDSHPSDLTDAKWDRGSTDGEIFLVLRDGAGPDFVMKGLKARMSETDMWNVVNYLRSIGPKK
jgi:mono/diheme cytochrome c family protein